MADDLAQQNLLALKNKSFDIKFDLRNSNYKAIENIGTGAYGVVCSAEHILSKKKVAIKKIPDIFEQPTIAKRTYREIKILKHFKHENVIAIRDILKPAGENESLRDVYMVLDLMETDMHRIIHSKQEITDEHVRYFLYQILRGLKYIHSANVIHRDLKPSNLLVNENCDIKIGDFGMARGIFSDPEDYNLMMTQYVATRWYRAPELLMAGVAYTGAVDMWSVGCIFAEMLGRTQIFAGKDYIHQLKLIIGIMGSPEPNFMQLIQSPAIRKFINSWGVKKPVPLQKLYPKAPSQAIDLLTRTLALNPDNRVSVECALSHPFLKKYHDPQDEPSCVPAFDFDFEKKDMTPPELKAAILKEIQDYHPVYEKPRVAFNFRPVPKSEINQKASSPKKKSPAIHSETFISSDKDANFGLNAFLTQIRKSDKKDDIGQENKPVGKAAMFLQQQNLKSSEFSGSGQPLSFLSTNSPKLQSTEFKVPIGLPLGKQNNQVKHEAEDVEMLSAKSQMKVETDSKPPADVEMLSANKLEAVGPKRTVEQDGPEVKVKGEREEGDKGVNTKEVLKAAILNAALRKQKGVSTQKERPKTALQRQKEREEKKRKKAEKAQERKKKQREKEKLSKGIMLSDEDKNLLQRWTTMQQQPSKQASHTASAATNAGTGERTEVAYPEKATAGTLTQNALFQQAPVTMKEQATVSQSSNTVIGSHETDTSSINSQTKVFSATEQIPPSLSSSHVTCMNSTVVPNESSVRNFAFPENNPETSGEVNVKMGVNNQLTQPENEDTGSVELTNKTEAHQPTDPSFDNSDIYSYSLPSLSPLDTHMKTGNGELDDILNQFVNEESQDKLPPSYPEALQAKMYTSSPPNSVHNNAVLKGTKDGFLPFQTYSPSEDSLKSVYSPEMPFEQASTSSANNPTENGNMLSVITRQMMRSHMDDLTLTKTPKGTGGTGYGVGTDLESLMEEAAKDLPLDRSAPISATESLIGDWLEVSGMKTLDAKEYEALEKELGLESPINIHELVNTPSKYS